MYIVGKNKKSIRKGIISLIRRVVGTEYLTSSIESANSILNEKQDHLISKADESTKMLEASSKKLLELTTRIGGLKESIQQVIFQVDTNSTSSSKSSSNTELLANSAQNIREDIAVNMDDLTENHPRLGRSLISIQNETRFDIAGNFNIFYRIVSDMCKSGGDLVPSGVWSEYTALSSIGYSDVQQPQEDDLFAAFSSKLSTLGKMLDPWIGQIGMQMVNMTQVNVYKPLLEKIDLCGLNGDDIYTTASNQRMRNADLGSIMDVNLIANLIPMIPHKRYSVLEVGGGYGRLAEALTNGIDNSFHYVMIDAVPGSLLYAKAYLEKAFPEKHIGFYLDDNYDTTFDFYILPPWHINRIINTEYDLCINVSSMQEMSQNHVDFYLHNFDLLTKKNGHIYIANSREYLFKGTWNFPVTWEMLICHNTPRSWTSDHPTWMFKKTDKDFSKKNYILEGLHALQVDDWRLKTENACLKNEIDWRNEELNSFRQNT